MLEIIRIISDLTLAILIIVYISTEKANSGLLFSIREFISSIFSLLKQIQMDQQSLAADLTALKEQQAKANAEIVSKISDLETALANGGPVTQEVQDALDALKSTVQASDDIVPDAPAPVEEPPAETV